MKSAGGTQNDDGVTLRAVPTEHSHGDLYSLRHLFSATGSDPVPTDATPGDDASGIGPEDCPHGSSMALNLGTLKKQTTARRAAMRWFRPNYC
jgi:hypothetical protein